MFAISGSSSIWPCSPFSIGPQSELCVLSKAFRSDDSICCRSRIIFLCIFFACRHTEAAPLEQLIILHVVHVLFFRRLYACWHLVYVVSGGGRWRSACHSVSVFMFTRRLCVCHPGVECSHHLRGHRLLLHDAPFFVASSSASACPCKFLFF